MDSIITALLEDGLVESANLLCDLHGSHPQSHTFAPLSGTVWGDALAAWGEHGRARQLYAAVPATRFAGPADVQLLTVLSPSVTAPAQCPKAVAALRCAETHARCGDATAALAALAPFAPAALPEPDDAAARAAAAHGGALAYITACGGSALPLRGLVLLARLHDDAEPSAAPSAATVKGTAAAAWALVTTRCPLALEAAVALVCAGYGALAAQLLVQLYPDSKDVALASVAADGAAVAGQLPCVLAAMAAYRARCRERDGSGDYDDTESIDGSDNNDEEEGGEEDGHNANAMCDDSFVLPRPRVRPQSRLAAAAAAAAAHARSTAEGSSGGTSGKLGFVSPLAAHAASLRSLTGRLAHRVSGIGLPGSTAVGANAAAAGGMPAPAPQRRTLTRTTAYTAAAAAAASGPSLAPTPATVARPRRGTAAKLCFDTPALGATPGPSSATASTAVVAAAAATGTVPPVTPRGAKRAFPRPSLAPPSAAAATAYGHGHGSFSLATPAAPAPATTARTRGAGALPAAPQRAGAASRTSLTASAAGFAPVPMVVATPAPAASAAVPASAVGTARVGTRTSARARSSLAPAVTPAAGFAGAGAAPATAARGRGATVAAATAVGARAPAPPVKAGRRSSAATAGSARAPLTAVPLALGDSDDGDSEDDYKHDSRVVGFSLDDTNVNDEDDVDDDDDQDVNAEADDNGEDEEQFHDAEVWNGDDSFALNQAVAAAVAAAAAAASPLGASASVEAAATAAALAAVRTQRVRRNPADVRFVRNLKATGAALAESLKLAADAIALWGNNNLIEASTHLQSHLVARHPRAVTALLLQATVEAQWRYPSHVAALLQHVRTVSPLVTVDMDILLQWLLEAGDSVGARALFHSMIQHGNARARCGTGAALPAPAAGSASGAAPATLAPPPHALLPPSSAALAFPRAARGELAVAAALWRLTAPLTLALTRLVTGRPAHSVDALLAAVPAPPARRATYAVLRARAAMSPAALDAATSANSASGEPPLSASGVLARAELEAARIGALAAAMGPARDRRLAAAAAEAVFTAATIAENAVRTGEVAPGAAANALVTARVELLSAAKMAVLTATKGDGKSPYLRALACKAVLLTATGPERATVANSLTVKLRDILGTDPACGEAAMLLATLAVRAGGAGAATLVSAACEALLQCARASRAPEPRVMAALGQLAEMAHSAGPDAAARYLRYARSEEQDGEADNE